MSSISVSNVKLGMSASYYTADTLTQTTKKKLIELGIPITKGMTETEAKQKIAKAEEAKNTQNQSGSNRDDNAMTLLLLKLRQLAQEVGIHVSPSDTAKKILDNIKRKINRLISITKPEDTETIAILKGFKSRHRELKVELEQIEHSYNKVFSAMDMISQNNRIHFGLT